VQYFCCKNIREENIVLYKMLYIRITAG